MTVTSGGTCPATHGDHTRCQLPQGHEGDHQGPRYLYMPNMPLVRWPNVSKRIEKYWPVSDSYNDSREDVDKFNEKKGGGIW